MFRIGQGYDVHKFAENRKLIIGGVDIPNKLGLDGHSDADVLVHALMDAMLGALALGDIGKHFPDNDSEYLGADSLKLLKKVNDDIVKLGWKLENADCTIIAQAPKLAPYIDEMRKNIADTINADISQISVKATTEEGLGFTGAKLGIAAQAIVLIDN